MQSSSVGGLAAREMRERCQAGTAGGRPMGSFAQLDKRTAARISFLSHCSNRQKGRGKGGRARKSRSVRNLEVVGKLFNN